MKLKELEFHAKNANVNKLNMWLAHLGVVISLILHVLDQVKVLEIYYYLFNLKLILQNWFQASDVFAGVLFYFEGHVFTSYITLALVFLPGFCICLTELRQTFCSNNCSLFKALAYLLFSPLWAIIIHFYR